jgi:hypothetical protein
VPPFCCRKIGEGGTPAVLIGVSRPPAPLRRSFFFEPAASLRPPRHGKDVPLPKRSFYKYEKHQKDLAKKQKKEEKRLRRLEKRRQDDAESEPAEGGAPEESPEDADLDPTRAD